MKMVIAALALTLLAGTAKADSTWDYQGNVNNYGGMFYNPGPGGVIPPGDLQPNPCNCALSGSVTVDASYNVLSWSFAAAGDTWTNANSAGSFDVLIASGNPFVLWGLGLTNTSGDTLQSGYTTFSMLSARDSTGNGDLMVLGDPGTWTEAVGTPEPGTLALLGIGLAGFALKRKKRVDSTVWEPLG
jgi:PEP-CTERM motif